MNDGPLWCLLSGGKDSVCTASVLASQGRLAGCVFIDTGIACPDTKPFVEQLCQAQGWNLRIYASPLRYDDLVLEYGFPKDLKGHSWAYGALKERAILAALRNLGKQTVFASGVRSRESARRSRNAGKGFRHNHGIVIENPIQNWTTREVWAYLKAHDLPTSPSYTFLGRSGDCLCGAFSKRGEADAILRAYPDVAARIRGLEERVSRTINKKTGKPFRYPQNRWGGSRSMGGFQALTGRQSLEQLVCGGDCTTPEENDRYDGDPETAGKWVDDPAESPGE